MKNIFLGKFQKYTRRALAIVLAFGMFFGATGIAEADSSIAMGYCGYKWTRIKNYDALNNWYTNGATDKDRYKLVQSYTGDYSDNDQTHWARFMLIYSDDKYFTSGTSTCNDGESYAGQRIYTNYGIDPTKDEFSTRTGLGTPYMRYAGADSDNNGCPQFYVRFANDTDTGIGNSIMGLNCSWYGVINHSLIYGYLRITSASNPSTTRRAFACHATLNTKINLKFYGENAEFYYNVKGDSDRWWKWEDHDYEIELDKSERGKETEFKFYLGQPIAVSIRQTDEVLPKGSTTTYANTTIKEGTKITVPKNSTLVISGRCYNNGQIYVNGGTLIVNGILESDTGKSKTNGLYPGNIVIDNGGTFIVAEEAAVIIRSETSDSYANSIELKNRSSATISGSVAVTGDISLTNSTYRVRPGACSIAGFVVDPLVDGKTFGRTYIATYKDKYLDYFGKPSSIHRAYHLYGASSIYCDGLLYCSSDTGVALHDTAKGNWWGIVHWNYNAKVSDMMSQF